MIRLFSGRNAFFLMKGYFLQILIIIILLAFSCKNPEKNSGDQYSPNFQKQIALADNLIDEGKSEQALHLIDSAVNAGKITAKDKFSYYGFYFGYHYKYSRDLKKARAYADSMQIFADAQADRESFFREDAEAKYAIGDILFDQQKYNEAYEKYFNARLIGKTAFDPCNLSEYSFRMGMILYKQTNFKSAANYFIQSYNEGMSCATGFPAFFRKQQVLDNIALCYYKIGDLNRSMTFFNKAENLLRSKAHLYPDKQLFIEMANGVVYGNKAQVLKDQGKYREAELLFLKSIKINSQKNHDVADANLARLHLADMYLQEKRLPNALRMLNDAGMYLHVHQDRSAKLEWCRLMWKYYGAAQQPALAYQHLLGYTMLKDSVSKEMRALSGANVDEQLKALESQYENGILKKGSELSSLYLKIAIGTAILLVIITVLVFKNWREKDKNIKSLTLLNNQVSEQKAKLQHALEDLERGGREKDRILRAVAHDLRNPIGGVSSLSEVFLDEPGLSDEQREIVTLIKCTCLDALQLINEILELAVLDNLDSLPKEKVDVNSMLANVVELLKFKAAEKNQKLILKMLEPPAQIMVNREKIGRVISNLVSNAIKFSPSGSVIKIGATAETDLVEIAVEDSGIGIPEAIQGKVFDTFTDAKRVGTSGEKPFGLGLSISQQIIEAHGGKIWFESEVDKGSTFYVELKRAE